MRKLLYSSLALYALFLSHANAVVNLDFSQVGADVVLTITGSHDVYSASVSASFTSSIVGLDSGFNRSYVLTGSYLDDQRAHGGINTAAPWDGVSPDIRDATGGVGTGGFTYTSTTYFAYAPTGYTVGDPISATNTFSNLTLADFGFDASDISAGFGVVDFVNAPDFTWSVNGVPEPSATAILVGLVAIGAVTRRRRT
ncbi:MAG: PEP-CTERM sorting domain-containing protein [Verrucomicrobiota bacterium]